MTADWRAFLCIRIRSARCDGCGASGPVRILSRRFLSRAYYPPFLPCHRQEGARQCGDQCICSLSVALPLLSSRVYLFFVSAAHAPGGQGRGGGDPTVSTHHTPLPAPCPAGLVGHRGWSGLTHRNGGSNLRFWGKVLAPKAPKFFFFGLLKGNCFTLRVHTQNTQNFVENAKMGEKG